MAEKEGKHKINVSRINPAETHPVNYKVPSFGVDQEILDSKNNLKFAEKKLNHKLNLENGGKTATGVDDFDGHPMSYSVPNFGVD